VGWPSVGECHHLSAAKAVGSDLTYSMTLARRGTAVVLLAVGLAACSGVPTASTKPSTTGIIGAPSSATPSPSLSPLASLDADVAAQSARETRAAASDPSQAIWPPNVAEYSQPVADAGGYVAVAAFGFDPNGQPVQVLSYSHGSWMVIAALAPPSDPGTLDHPDSLNLFGSTDNTANISVGYATGSAPDFLIPFAGAGCGRGPVVSDASGTWQYLPFVGDFPTTEVVGGNPRFDGGTVVFGQRLRGLCPPGPAVLLVLDV
jgi:hypothetical protein